MTAAPDLERARLVDVDELAKRTAAIVVDELAKRDRAYQLPAEVSDELRRFGSLFCRMSFVAGPGCYCLEIHPGAVRGSVELVLTHGNGTRLAAYRLEAAPDGAD